MAHRASLAQILFQRDYADITGGVFGGQFERCCAGIVSRAVVYDEDLE